MDSSTGLRTAQGDEWWCAKCDWMLANIIVRSALILQAEIVISA